MDFSELLLLHRVAGLTLRDLRSQTHKNASLNRFSGQVQLDPDPEHTTGDYISHLSWSRNVWIEEFTLLSLLPQQPDRDKLMKMDGWMNR